jgi:hypothetical protein
LSVSPCNQPGARSGAGNRRNRSRGRRRGRRSAVQNSDEKLLRTLAQVPTRSGGEHASSRNLAKGEELGSNLLRVAQSNPRYPGGSGSFCEGQSEAACGRRL